MNKPTYHRCEPPNQVTPNCQCAPSRTQFTAAEVERERVYLVVLLWVMSRWCSQALLFTLHTFLTLRQWYCWYRYIRLPGRNYRIHKFHRFAPIGRFWRYIKIHLLTVSPHLTDDIQPSLRLWERSVTRSYLVKLAIFSVITAFSWIRSGWNRTSFVVRPIQNTVWRETQSCTSQRALWGLPPFSNEILMSSIE